MMIEQYFVDIMPGMYEHGVKIIRRLSALPMHRI